MMMSSRPVWLVSTRVGDDQIESARPDREAGHQVPVRLQRVDVVVVGAEDDVELACPGDVADGWCREDRVGVIVRGASGPWVERALGLEHEAHLAACVEGLKPTLLVVPPQRARTHDDRGRPVRTVEIRDRGA